ncbi:MAG: hypothetical protein ACRDGA_12195, partial [Bacteroidota bacterium]
FTTRNDIETMDDVVVRVADALENADAYFDSRLKAYKSIRKPFVTYVGWQTYFVNRTTLAQVTGGASTFWANNVFNDEIIATNIVWCQS